VLIRQRIKLDGFVKSPSAALRFIFSYFAVLFMTFYEFIKLQESKQSKIRFAQDSVFSSDENQRRLAIEARCSRSSGAGGRAEAGILSRPQGRVPGISFLGSRSHKVRPAKKMWRMCSRRCVFFGFSMSASAFRKGRSSEADGRVIFRV
jgi:hypothetical protein